jgi:hypothetical protein
VADPPSGTNVDVKEARLFPFGANVFHVGMGAGIFKGNFMTFEPSLDGGMVLNWRNYVFKRRP